MKLISNMEIKIKKLDKNAVIPQYAHPGDAGMDIVATSITETEDYIEYGTDLAFRLPDNHVMLIFPRSSNSKKDLLLCNSVGVLDSQYIGELKIRYKRTKNPSDKIYSVGERVAQIMILPYPKVEFKEVEELSQTERGEGGFGSTGK